MIDDTFLHSCTGAE